jgi:hypothetical protein
MNIEKLIVPGGIMAKAIGLDGKSIGQKIRLCRVGRGWIQAILSAILDANWLNIGY